MDMQGNDFALFEVGKFSKIIQANDATRALAEREPPLSERVIWGRKCRVRVAPSHVAKARVEARRLRIQKNYTLRCFHAY